MATGRRALLFFRDVSDESFGGQHQCRNRPSIGQRGAVPAFTTVDLIFTA
jgi:hypothetical protein